MNIFATHKDAAAAAQALDDKRVVKMFLESMQMLATAIHLHGDKSLLPISAATQNPYKIAFPNHPCSVWTRGSIHNYRWLLDHAYFLHAEHNRRSGKGFSPLHYFNLQLVGRAAYSIKLSNRKMGFANCSMFKKMSVHEGYRLTMVHKWCFTDKRQPKWTNVDQPSWIVDYYEQINRMFPQEPKWLMV